MPSLKCPHCSRVLKVSEKAAGKRINCPACKKAFLAPKPPSKPGGPPPVSSAARPWHLHLDGRNVGPFAEDAVVEQLKTGKATGSTLAWKEGMDDWKPLREVREFHSAVRSARMAAKTTEGEEAEPRRHYVPGRSKRDVVLGAWIAVGLAVVLVIVILYVASRPPPEPPERVVKRIVVPPPEAPIVTPRGTTSTTAAPGTATPTKTPKKREKPKAPNERALARAVREVRGMFDRAFSEPEKADTMPIFRLRDLCRKHAEELRSRQWGPYQSQVDKLAGLFEDTAKGIDSQLTFLSQKWQQGVTVIPEDFLEDIAFLKNWRQAIDDAVQRIRDRGYEF